MKKMQWNKSGRILLLAVALLAVAGFSMVSLRDNDSFPASGAEAHPAIEESIRSADSNETEVQSAPAEPEQITDILYYPNAESVPPEDAAIDSFGFWAENRDGQLLCGGENCGYLSGLSLARRGNSLILMFSIYQNVLPQCDALLSRLNSCVTKNYEGLAQDGLQNAQSAMRVEINGSGVSILAVEQGKGNGHQDYFFVLETDGMLPGEVHTLSARFCPPS